MSQKTYIEFRLDNDLVVSGFVSPDTFGNSDQPVSGDTFARMLTGAKVTQWSIGPMSEAAAAFHAATRVVFKDGSSLTIDDTNWAEENGGTPPGEE